MSLRSFGFLVPIAVALSSSGGCGNDGLKTVPVYGQVNFVGREAPKTCRLYFKPIQVEGLNRATVADRQSNGSYAANALSSSKGLIPGKYKIDITYYDLPPGKDANVRENWMPVKFDGGELDVPGDSRGVEHDIEVSPKPGKK